MPRVRHRSEPVDVDHGQLVYPSLGRRRDRPPSRGRADAGVLAAGLKPDAASRSRSISARKIFVSAATARGRSARNRRNRLGTEITHCRTGTGGMTRSTRCAAVWAMWRPLQDGQTPRPLWHDVGDSQGIAAVGGEHGVVGDSPCAKRPPGRLRSAAAHPLGERGQMDVSDWPGTS